MTTGDGSPDLVALTALFGAPGKHFRPCAIFVLDMPADRYTPPTDWAPVRAVPAWTPQALPVLVAPVWGRQEALGETEAAYAAFTAWLPAGDLLAAANHVQIRHAEAAELARHYSWEARGREYWAHARTEGAAAIHEEAAPARESRSMVRESVNKALALLIIELDKAMVEAKLPRGATPPDGPPRLFNNRELTAWLGNVGRLDVMRERAGIANAAMGPGDEAPALDFERLDGDELEAWRRAREKALGR